MRHRPAAPDPPLTPAEEARCLAIAREVWFGFDERADRVQKLIEVEEALRGPHVSIPTLSAVDRARIEQLAKEIP
jgi:hypothetical protein